MENYKTITKRLIDDCESLRKNLQLRIDYEINSIIEKIEMVSEVAAFASAKLPQPLAPKIKTEPASDDLHKPLSEYPGIIYSDPGQLKPKKAVGRFEYIANAYRTGGILDYEESEI